MKLSEKIKQTVSIASLIVRLRVAMSWSQTDLARKAGVTSAAISQLEKGSRMPSLRVATKLAATFGMSLSEFMGDGETHPEMLKNYTYKFYIKYKELYDLTPDQQDLILKIIQHFKKVSE